MKNMRIWTILVTVLSGVVVAGASLAVPVYGADPMNYFTFSNTAPGTCPAGNSPCDGGTTGLVKSSGKASGFGMFAGFTTTNLEFTFQWSYRSGTFFASCPSSMTLHGIITGTTGPSPVAVKAAITVVLVGGNSPSGTMTVTSGTFTDTLTGNSLLFCPV